MKLNIGRKKAVTAQVIGGYLITAVNIVQGLFLIPFYLHYINASMYGNWLTIQSVIAILSIINFGINNLAIQRISSNFSKNNYEKVSEYFIASMFIYFIITIIIVISGTVFTYFLDIFLKIDEKEFQLMKTVYLIALLTLAINVFTNAFLGFSQAMLKPTFGVISSLLAKIIGIILVVALLTYGYGLIALPISLLITEIIIFALNSIYSYKLYRYLHKSAKLYLSTIKEYLKMSPSLFGIVAGDRMSNMSHPILITTFIGPEATTAYTVTRKAAEILLHMLNIFNSSLIAPFSHLVGEGNKEKIKKVVIKILFASSFISLVLFAGFIGSDYIFVSLWIGQELVLSQNIILLIGFGTIAYSMTRLFRNLLLGLDEFKFVSKIIFSEGLLFIILSILLTFHFDIAAIPLALFFSSTLFAFIMIKRIFDKIFLTLRTMDLVVFSVISLSIILLSTNDKLFINNTNISWGQFVTNALLSTVLTFALLSIFIYRKFIFSVILPKRGTNEREK